MFTTTIREIDYEFIGDQVRLVAQVEFASDDKPPRIIRPRIFGADEASLLRNIEATRMRLEAVAASAAAPSFPVGEAIAPADFIVTPTPPTPPVLTDEQIAARQAAVDDQNAVRELTILDQRVKLGAMAADDPVYLKALETAKATTQAQIAILAPATAVAAGVAEAPVGIGAAAIIK
jgi:hypothetical protein